MNHQKYNEWVKLSVFGELTEAQNAELQNHINECEICKKEFEELRKLTLAAKENLKNEPDDNLLFEARQQLKASLRRERIRKSPGDKFRELMFFQFNYPIRFALSAVILIGIGILIGYAAFFQTKSPAPQVLITETAADNFLRDNVRIENIRFIDKDPSDGEIEFVFEAIKPIRIKGSIYDKTVKNILMYSLLNENNPGTRLNSLYAISSEHSKPFDDDVKNALLTVVKYDNNPGVRREALLLLKKFPYDDQIKETLLFILLQDSSSAMRIEAINSLYDANKEGFKLDKDEVSLFKDKLSIDENTYIRYRAQAVLKENL